jgi:hypothetical protein
MAVTHRDCGRGGGCPCLSGCPESVGRNRLRTHKRVAVAAHAPYSVVDGACRRVRCAPGESRGVRIADPFPASGVNVGGAGRERADGWAQCGGRRGRGRRCRGSDGRGATEVACRRYYPCDKEQRPRASGQPHDPSVAGRQNSDPHPMVRPRVDVLGGSRESARGDHARCRRLSSGPIRQVSPFRLDFNPLFRRSRCLTINKYWLIYCA